MVFNPQETDEDDREILKEFTFLYALKLAITDDYRPSINISGNVLGPRFQLESKSIDIGSIFLGESTCIDVGIANTGTINGKIIFQESLSAFNGIVKVSPKFKNVLSGRSQVFKLEYLARKPGKFVEQAVFKVKNGERLSFVIQGVVKPLEIVTKPAMIAFGVSTICVPKMQVLKLRNELPFNVEVKIEVESTGTDEPLEFLEFFQSKLEDVAQEETSSSTSISMESYSSLLARLSIRNFMTRSGKLESLRRSISSEDSISKVYSHVNKALERTEIVQSIIDSLFEGKVNE